MSKYFNIKMRRPLALVIAVMMIVMLAPLSVVAAGNPGEGAIPVPAGYKASSDGKETDNPGALEPGQIWVNKNVEDNEDGTFDITLYVWGAEYKDDENVTRMPLDPDDANVVITDTVGAMFDLTGTANYSVGSFDETDGVVTWTVSQDDILSLRECKFTVSLKSGWEIDTRYFTNEGAAAAFKPMKGNPYYWSKQIETKVSLTLSGIKWNNGWDHGVQTITIEDKDLGIKLVIEDTNKNPRMFVTGNVNRNFTYDSSRASATFPTASYTPVGTVKLPDNVLNAADGTWGIYRTKGTNINGLYYYIFWFMGLEGTGKVTTYIVTTDNPGGNNGNAGNTRYTSSTHYMQRSGFNWQPDDSIKQDLPNKGWIELRLTSVNVDPIDVTVNKDITKSVSYSTIPGDADFIFELKDTSGNVLATKIMSSAAYLEDNKSVTLTIPGAVYDTINTVKTYTITERISGTNWETNTQEFTLTADVNGNVKIKANGAEVNDITFNNKYTHIPTGSLTVTKVWGPGAPEQEVSFKLYKGVGEQMAAQDGEYVLNSKNEWTTTIPGLEIGATYSVIENPLDDIYGDFADPVYSHPEGVQIAVNGTHEILITNKYNTPKAVVIVEKIWNHGGNPMADYPEELVIYLNGTQYKLTEGNDGKWGMTLTNMELGAYSVSETVPADYRLNENASVLSGTATIDSRTVTLKLVNDYVTPVGELTINKIWNDGYDDGLANSRPMSVNIEVTGPGEYSNTVTLNEGNGWSDTLTGLALGVYTIEETDLNGDYDVTYSPSVDDEGDVGIISLTKTNRAGTIYITNTDNNPKGEITVTKVWADEWFTGYRPESVTLYLMNDGDLVGSIVLPNQDGSWSHTFEDLDLIGGYYLEEALGFSELEYDFIISGDVGTDGCLDLSRDNRSGEIIGTNVFGNGILTVTKSWDHGTNPRQQRPSATVTVSLFDDEGLVETATFRGSYTFYNLDLEKEYYIAEQNVSGYTSSASNGGYVTFNGQTAAIAITNTYNEPSGQLTISKIVEGPADPNAANAVFTIEVLRNGRHYETVTLSANTSTALTIPSSAFGSFSIRERNVPENYVRLGYSDNNSRGQYIGYGRQNNFSGALSVTNEYIIPTGSIEVNKDWQDEAYAYARPDSVTINLYRYSNGAKDDNFGQSIELSEDNDWNGTFSDLLIHDNDGFAYTYTVVESGAGNDYTATYSTTGITLTKGALAEVTVTNTVKVPTGRLNVAKVWEEGYEDYELRSVVVNLVVDGRVTRRAMTLSARNNWNGTFGGLDIYRSYSVVETIDSENWAPVYLMNGEEITEGVSFDNDNDSRRLSIVVENRWIGFEGDIEITKDANTGSKILEDGAAEFVYTLVVTNKSNKALTDVIVTDTLPGGVAGIKDASMDFTIDGNVITFEIGNLGLDRYKEISYTVVFGDAGKKINTAVVTAKHFELEGELTDEDSEEVTVKEPGLNIIKVNTNSGNSVTLSGGKARLDYTLTVMNKGDVAFDSVEIKDEFTKLPDGAAIEYIFEDTDDVAFDAETLTFTIKEGLEIDQSMIIKYSVVVDKAGEYNNGAVVTGYYDGGSRSDDDNDDARVNTPPPDDPYIPENPRTPDPDPVVPDPVEIVDEEPPLAQYIPEEEPEVDVVEELEIEEEIVPLSDMPQTGIEDTSSLWILALCASLLMAWALSVMVTKTSRKND